MGRYDQARARKRGDHGPAVTADELAAIRDARKDPTKRKPITVAEVARHRARIARQNRPGAPASPPPPQQTGLFGPEAA